MAEDEPFMIGLFFVRNERDPEELELLSRNGACFCPLAEENELILALWC